MFNKDEFKWQKKKEEMLLTGTIEQQKLENNFFGFSLGISLSLFLTEVIRVALHVDSELLRTCAFVGSMAICTYTPGATFSSWAKLVEKKAAKEAKLHPYNSKVDSENLEKAK